MLCDK
jgi:hypothetical protein